FFGQGAGSRPGLSHCKRRIASIIVTTLATPKIATNKRSLTLITHPAETRCAEIPAIPARPLEQLLGRRTGALTNFFANVRIVLRRHQERNVFLNQEALVGDSLRQGINGLVQHALLIGGGRHGYPLLIVLLETGHALDGGCRRVELLVRGIRRLLSQARRRGGSSHCSDEPERDHGFSQHDLSFPVHPSK